MLSLFFILPLKPLLIRMVKYEEWVGLELTQISLSLLSAWLGLGFYDETWDCWH
jgi:hypothetical protein